MPTTQPSILVCTVGGSHQPIVTTIKEIAPAFVCFLCTGRDPATGKPGSEVQVTGQGNIIKPSPKDEKPTLPNIPTQTGLSEGRFEVRLVPPDDLDRAVTLMDEAIEDLKRRFSGSRIVADYTGGTKTMTAALVISALEHNDVELRLVSGARPDLVKVADGTQRSVAACSDMVQLRRAMAPYLSAWGRFAYGEAWKGLSGLSAPHDPHLRSELQTATDLSMAFDAWDRFDHKEALRILDIYAGRIGRKLPGHLAFLKILCADAKEARREPALLYDLWMNAQRRASQARYDDAVSRLYRLIEWTAQWILKSGAGIDTSDVPADRIPEGMDIVPDKRGRRPVPLFKAWELIVHLLPESGPAAFFSRTRERMHQLLAKRNLTILAHGYTPVSESDWLEFSGWMEEFMPMFRKEAERIRLGLDPPQLPRERCWE